jgi:hypothetical protein
MARLAMRRGFTTVDLVALSILSVIIIVFLAGVFLPARGRGGTPGRLLKDSTQIRGIHQAMVVWIQSNNDQFPLPSRIDLNDFTVPEQGPAKDTTANIYSMLIWVGSVGTEMFISPAEVNGNINMHETYEFQDPRAAVNPAKALWDPAFRADFTSQEGGHTSYAHLLPSGPRSKLWRNDFNAATPILGNRGQQVAAVQYNKAGIASPVYANPQSNTLLIHGTRARWEGNIAFNDNHVEFVTTPKSGHYTAADGSKREDLLFFDEPDDPTGLNYYLGIFTKAGPEPKNFRAIWD